MQIRRLILLLIPIVLLFSACNQPAHAFIDTQGHKISTTDWKGKWVIINYWATWCDACAEEIPQLNLFYQHKQNQVVMIGVNFDDLAGADLVNAVNQLNIHFPVLQTNPARALGLPALSVLPTTYLINPQGKIVKQLIGPQTAAGLEEMIQ